MPCSTPLMGRRGALAPFAPQLAARYSASFVPRAGKELCVPVAKRRDSPVFCICVLVGSAQQRTSDHAETWWPGGGRRSSGVLRQAHGPDRGKGRVNSGPGPASRASGVGALGWGWHAVIGRNRKQVVGSYRAPGPALSANSQ